MSQTRRKRKPETESKEIVDDNASKKHRKQGKKKFLNDKKK